MKKADRWKEERAKLREFSEGFLKHLCMTVPLYKERHVYQSLDYSAVAMDTPIRASVYIHVVLQGPRESSLSESEVNAITGDIYNDHGFA